MDLPVFPHKNHSQSPLHLFLSILHHPVGLIDGQTDRQGVYAVADHKGQNHPGDPAPGRSRPLFPGNAAKHHQHGIGCNGIVELAIEQDDQQEGEPEGPCKEPEITVFAVENQPDQSPGPDRDSRKVHQELCEQKILQDHVAQLGILQFGHMGDHRPVVLVLPEQVGQDQQQSACHCPEQVPGPE